jgi:hypothetical protein
MFSFKKFRQMQEDGGAAMVAGPTNVTAGVAGIGAGPAKFAEPGVNKKKNNPVMNGMFTRKPPKM